MSDPLARLDERTAALRAAAQEVREETRRAHEATKELRTAQREIRDLLETDVPALVDRAIDVAVAKGLADYSDTVQTAMRNAVTKVEREFDKLARIYMDGEDDGESIHDLAMKKKRRAAGDPLRAVLLGRVRPSRLRGALPAA